MSIDGIPRREVKIGLSFVNAPQARHILVDMSLSVEPMYEPKYLNSVTILTGSPSIRSGGDGVASIGSLRRNCSIFLLLNSTPTSDPSRRNAIELSLCSICLAFEEGYVIGISEVVDFTVNGAC